jgi:RND family efflux transporter MFP subunit
MIADRNAAAALVEGAKAAVETAQLNRDFCHVTAPISGQISRRYVDPGNLIKADDTILTSIVSVENVYAYFEVDERTLLMFRRLISEGKIQSASQTKVKVDMALADEQGYVDKYGEPRHQGTIDFGDNKVDPATGTIQVRAVFDNKERILSPGMFVRVRSPIGRPHPAVLIPEQALSTDQGQKFVYIVTTESKVDVRYVRVGPQHGDLRVIQEGLKPDERVIVSGLQQVRRGLKVEVKTRSQESGVRAQGSGVRGEESTGKDGSAAAKSH